jgi:hypothetical protein
LIAFFLLLAALFVALIAVATDNASLPPALLVIRSYVLGGRINALLIGLIVGALANRRRHLLGRGFSQLYASIMGDTGNTAWAFQTAIALVLVAIAVFAVRVLTKPTKSIQLPVTTTWPRSSTRGSMCCCQSTVTARCPAIRNSRRKTRIAFA